MKLLLTFLSLCCVNGIFADNAPVLESVVLLGMEKEAAHQLITSKLLPGSTVSEGVKSKSFGTEQSGKPVYLYVGDDGKGKIRSAAWQFDGAKWLPKELLKMHQEIYRELSKRGWKIVKTAALVDNQQLFGRFETIPRGDNTVNIGVTLRRESPRAEITLVLGLPIDGVADDFVPALAVELVSNPREDMIQSDP